MPPISIINNINPFTAPGDANYTYIEGILNNLLNYTHEGQPSLFSMTGGPHNLPALTSNHQILPQEKFFALYEQADHTIKDCAGTLIFNEDLSEILLVKGRFSRKWGPPKGHREDGESNLETAIRETCEEIGHDINLKVNLLPYVVVNKIKLYCLIVPKSTRFQIRDAKEIAYVKWFTVTQLIAQLKSHPNDFNGSVRGLFDKPSTMKTITHKISSFKVHYNQAPNGSINEHLEKVINYLQTMTDINDHPKVFSHYICFYIIQRIYNNIFTNSDLIAFVRNHFKSVA